MRYLPYFFVVNLRVADVGPGFSFARSAATDTVYDLLAERPDTV
jgi:hypothetical protein